MSRYTVTTDQLNNLMYLVEDWAINDEHQPTYHPDYSGRGMYGDTCVGLVHDSPTIPTVFLYFLAEELGEDFLDLVADLRGEQDNMGLSTITYWRGLTVSDDDGKDDE